MIVKLGEVRSLRLREPTLVVGLILAAMLLALLAKVLS